MVSASQEGDATASKTVSLGKTKLDAVGIKKKGGDGGNSTKNGIGAEIYPLPENQALLFKFGGFLHVPPLMISKGRCC